MADERTEESYKSDDVDMGNWATLAGNIVKVACLDYIHLQLYKRRNPNEVYYRKDGYTWMLKEIEDNLLSFFYSKKFRDFTLELVEPEDLIAKCDKKVDERWNNYERRKQNESSFDIDSAKMVQVDN